MNEKVTERIGELAAAYTPEWRFSVEQPDMGSSLALLFAEFMDETLKAFSELPESHRMHFFNCLGAELLPGTPAVGFMTFDLIKPDMPPAVIPKGTGVEGEGTDGNKVQFETLKEVAVSPSRVDPEAYDGEEGIYLRFSLPLSGPIHSLLAVVKPGNSLEGRRICLEYEVENGFKAVPIEDTTMQLTCTGIIRFTKLPGMISGSRMGRNGFWLRIRNEGGGKPDHHIRFYMNAAPVKATEAGSNKNLPPMTKLKLMRTSGFVTDIKNPDVLYGGTDRESEAEAAKRMSARIRHRFQAVTAQDMERLAVEASRNIEKVKCFTGRNGSGVKKQGHVTLVVLQKDYEGGRRYFYRLKEEILKALKPAVSSCLADSGRLSVAAPWFVIMDVDVTVAAGDYDSVTELQGLILTALREYLNPVAGGYDKKGWEFGSLPGHGQIRHMLQRIPGVAYVGRMSIGVHLEAMGERKEMNYEDVSELPWTLPLSGSHDVTVTVG